MSCYEDLLSPFKSYLSVLFITIRHDGCVYVFIYILSIFVHIYTSTDIYVYM